MKKIAIHSVPRSGSTWLGSLFDSHPSVAYKFQPLFSYAFKSALSPNSRKKEITSFYEAIAATDDAFINQTEAKEKGLVPSFQKENIEAIAYKEVRYHHILENVLQQDPEVKVIGLVRNPLATINSWLRAPREFRADLGWEINKEWELAPTKNKNLLEEFNGYAKWKEVTLLFEELQNNYDNFYLLEYQNLLTDTVGAMESVFRFAELEMPPQTLAFINSSKANNQSDSYSVFKIKQHDNSWKENLPSYIVDSIEADLTDTPLEKYIKS